MRRNTTDTPIVKSGPGKDIRSYTNQQLKTELVRASADDQGEQLAEQLREELQHPDRQR